MPVDAAMIAGEILAARDAGVRLEPFTSRLADFDVATAYQVSAELRRLRGERGEQPVGRKIGFTNRNIWPEYGVFQPIWGEVYDTTVHDVTPGARIDISHLSQPRIEPEIVLGLDGDVRAGMSLAEIEAAIGWVAHGFEIVQTVFPDWKFQVADCVADGGLHGLLLVGPRTAIPPDLRTGLAARLSAIGIRLARDGEQIDAGTGTNVLDGPLHALAHLAEAVSSDETASVVRKGEIITTGTVTRAFPIAAGERWSTEVTAFDLPGLDIRFV